MKITVEIRLTYKNVLIERKEFTFIKGTNPPGEDAMHDLAGRILLSCIDKFTHFSPKQLYALTTIETDNQ